MSDGAPAMQGGPDRPRHQPLRPGLRLGKYRVGRRLGAGGYAEVFRARDTVQEIDVALKVPKASEFVHWLREEARLHTRLEHPNILPIKNADWIDGRFVIVCPLAERTLDERLRNRLSVASFVDLAWQMLQAVAHAHTHKVIHCDLKPDNFLLFPDGTVKLSDFGIAKLAMRTVKGSGLGTIGFIAPEQAMGRASFRSDVFSLGLIFWRMLSGKLPEWPLEWPLPGLERVRRKVPGPLVDFLRKSLEINPRHRHANAAAMLAGFERLRPAVLRFTRREALKRRPATDDPSWEELRHRQLLRRFRRKLRLDRGCSRCNGPISEFMSCCPWCAHQPVFGKDEVSFPARCPRCKRGRKLDWRYCAWCHGKAFATVATRTYSDHRYSTQCSTCRTPWMPFMRYCPGCRRKVAKPWSIEGNDDRCRHCGWGVVNGFWETCPWCKKSLK